MQQSKDAQIVQYAQSLLGASSITVRQLACLIGLFISCLHAIPLGKLHYHSLEICKLTGLKKGRKKYSAPCALTPPAIEDIRWWMTALPHTWAPIHRPPQITIYCDACTYGYRGMCEGLMTQGHFLPEEQDCSINTKECLAVYYSVCAFATQCANKHILVHSDNMTTISNVTNMGSMSSLIRSQIMKDLWQFVYSIGSWLTIRHIAGVSNSAADWASHHFRNNRTEWSLLVPVFQQISKHFGPFDMDLFASSLNNKVPWFCAWQPDAGAFAIDAFTVNWSLFANCYAMPPFSLITRVLQRVLTTSVTVIIVVPLWESQPWFPHLLDLLSAVPPLLPKTVQLFLPWDPHRQHSLQGQLRLLVCKVSGNPSNINDFYHWVTSMSLIPCNHQPSMVWLQPLHGGNPFARKGVRIPAIYL